MVFIQITDVQEPKVVTIRKIFEKFTGDKKQGNVLTRMGAIVGNGIMNASGRNSTISMTTHDGNLRQNAVVGLVLFLQHWYWYPMMNFLSLSLTPTTLIGVNHQLKVPKNFGVKVTAPPKTFKYPELLKKKEKEEAKKVDTAVLSTTSKVAARLQKKKSIVDDGTSKKDDDMDGANKNNEESKDVEMTNKEEPKKEEPEPSEYVESNPCRMLRQQELKVSYQ